MNGIIARLLDLAADTATTLASVFRCYADEFASAQRRVDNTTAEAVRKSLADWQVHIDADGIPSLVDVDTAVRIIRAGQR